MTAEVRAAIIEAIEGALTGGETVAVATVTDAGDPPFLAPGEKLLVRRDASSIGALGEDAVDEAVREVAAEAIGALPRVAVQTLYVSRNADASGERVSDEGGWERRTSTRRHQSEPGDARVMIQLFESPARLVIVGGGHVGLALAEMGEQLGFSVTVIDDREEFANAERFPMADEVRSGAIDEELDGITVDDSAYVVLVSRGHQQDEIALRNVVGRGAAYAGMIGSKRRTATVLQHLAEEGFDRAALDAVSTPIGLDIGAETPEEIAVSILAEIVQVRRGGTGQRMSQRRTALP
jgi:xanthine dehydrogenase accessory factor